MSTSKKKEITILLRAKLNIFCKVNDISPEDFFASLKISRSVWYNITDGKNGYFDTIVKIVTATNNYLQYEEFAELFSEENMVV